MEINITFVIQIINFGISYVFIKHVFLKPMVHLLVNQEIEFNKLLRDLKKNECYLQDKIIYQEKLFEDFKLHIKKDYMIQKEVGIQEIRAVVNLQDPKTVALYEETIKTLLINKAIHAY